MHDTAYKIAGKFFELYWKPSHRLIVELGACSINGSLRAHQPPGSRYLGLDIEAGPSVDVVIENSLNLPIADAEADCVVSSSTFEHDMFFWQSFLELCRITKPGGFLYLNTPSNGEFHRYPADYWRFYPDAGRGLAQWAAKSGIKVTLIESFVAARVGDQWNDFVAVFQRGEPDPRADREFLCSHFACHNIHRFDAPKIGAFESRTEDMMLLADARSSAQKAASQIEQLQRLVAADAESIGLSKAAAAQALADRDHERGIGQQASARVREVTDLLHSSQQQALSAARDAAARERELNEQMNSLRRQLFDVAQEAATREREAAEKYRLRENTIGVHFRSLLSEINQLSRILIREAATVPSDVPAPAIDDIFDMLKARVAALSAAAAAGEARRAALNRVIVERDSHIAGLREELGAIYGARAWRLTSPLRWMSSWFGPRENHPKPSVPSRPGPDEAPRLDVADVPTPLNAPQSPIDMAIAPNAPVSGARQHKAAAESLTELLQEQELAFVETAYRTLLKRAADQDGREFYLARLLSGFPKIQILLEMVNSTEAKRAGVELPGLATAIRRYRRACAPIIGPLIRLFVAAERNSLTDNRLRALEQQQFFNRRRFDDRLVKIGLQLHNLQYTVPASRDSAGLVRPKETASPAGGTPELEMHHSVESGPAPVDLRSIELRCSNEPLVSVIIPVYGQLEYTLRCLASIAANAPAAPIEVIVVDDCSPDYSAQVLSGINGLRLVHNEKNQGFIRSCNRGAKAARGEYLYFLNNDTQVTPGWADELLATFQVFPGTGFAGSKLIYPDGRLQEAGGIIWQDGSAWNFGRFQDQSLPVYNYAREVDYCSGASVMVPKALFEELGGFDERYLPAYCEDSDLALRIRAKNYRVIYQPMSSVIHYEGKTSGTDTSQGAKAHQIENSKKLFARWEDVLKSHEPNGVRVDDAKDRGVGRRVLVLDNRTPTPNQDAGSVTVFNLMLLLREMDFQVTFIPEGDLRYANEYTRAVQRAGIEILYSPYLSSVEQHLKEFGARYDLVFLFRPEIAERHLKTIRALCSRAKVLIHTVDPHCLQTTSDAADKMKREELSAVRGADAVIAHSSMELEILRKDLPGAKLHVLPLIMNVTGSDAAFEDRKDIAFIGGYQHAPNVDAVQYFVASIMPLLREALPGVRFYAFGSRPPPEILSMQSEDVIITGFHEDLDAFLDKIRVCVAPLRFGADLRREIGSAMAVGLPVVATSLGVEAMSLADGINVLVADGSEQLADTIVKIYRDRSLWSQIGRGALQHAERAWGAESAWASLAGIVRDLGFSALRNNRKLILYGSNLAPSRKSDSQSITNEEPSQANAAVDDAYRKRVQQELVNYQEQVKVHDLPEIFHYWSNKYIGPMCAEAGISTINGFFAANLFAAGNRTGSAVPRFVSVGAGNCDVEVAVAGALRDLGCKEFVFECVELNPAMLERGRAIAEENGVSQHMRFVESDFNTWTATGVYDGAMANHSLHHVSNLEHLYDQIKKGLHDDGCFVVSDMIGRNGHQRWPESLEIVEKFWGELPETYKFNRQQDKLELDFVNWDCSAGSFEGIRAQEVLPLILQRLQCQTFIAWGGVIDIFVDRGFGHNFDPKSEWDRAFIDKVQAENEAGLLSRRLTPTQMLAVFVKRLHGAPFYSRGLDPALSVRRP
jgi:GT2 family glycosyltransferase/SAM-dependent methyltransferase/glycosyltransferase involved in cell wall biosynthesis